MCDHIDGPPVYCQNCMGYPDEMPLNREIREARIVEVTTLDDVKKWCGGKNWTPGPLRAITGLKVKTPNGWKTVPYGQHIYRDDHGEFWVRTNGLTEAFMLLWDGALADWRDKSGYSDEDGPIEDALRDSSVPGHGIRGKDLYRLGVGVGIFERS